MASEEAKRVYMSADEFSGTLSSMVAERVLGLPPLEPGWNHMGLDLLSWSGIGLVVDAMREKGWGDFSLRLHNAVVWRATFYRPSEELESLDPLPWRAVYLAALAALEKE